MCLGVWEVPPAKRARSSAAAQAELAGRRAAAPTGRLVAAPPLWLGGLSCTASAVAGCCWLRPWLDCDVIQAAPFPSLPCEHCSSRSGMYRRVLCNSEQLQPSAGPLLGSISSSSALHCLVLFSAAL